MKLSQYHGRFERDPAAPKPLVDQILSPFGVVTDQCREHRMTDLGVTRLVGLDARDHFLEHPVADVVGDRREPDELEVGKARLEHEIGSDGEFERVRPNAHLIDEVPHGGTRPSHGRVLNWYFWN
jgi:hypothetical protein